ncbi:PP2 domain-containing protein, partial [Providencia rettgeri]
AVAKYGHCLQVLCKDSDVQLLWPSYDELYAQVSSGIIFNNKKYKLDKKTNSNWWWIYPRALSIAWVSDARYWKWINFTEAGEKWDVPELIQVSWFDVRVKISSPILSSRVVYVIYFIVKILPGASGWEVPVTLELKRPNGCKIESKLILNSLKRGEWVEIAAGDLSVDNCSCESGGEIEVGLYQHDGRWKKGLIIKGVEIRPKSCFA